jgi:UDPglucose--hexose-1-phosphate uridylyltransferase
VSELRQDPVTGVWTIVAPERAGRPKDFSRSAAERSDPGGCVFCPGNEHMTPPQRLARSLEGGRPGDWTVRVFENLFPAVSDDGAEIAEPIPAPGPYRALAGLGVHEVVVETPRHGEGLADYSPGHAGLLADVYAERLALWHDDPRFAAAVLFRNWGAAAGASLAHAHTQLVVLPRAPDAIVRELGNFTEGFSGGYGCVLCGANSADDDGGRTVFDDGVTVVQSPFAAPIPYFMRISPRRCSASLTDATREERASFGVALVAAAQAIRRVFGDVAFNVVVHVAPYSAERAGGLPFHWHADVILRTSDQAGLEWSSGAYINVVDPDAAAEALRG